MVNLADTNLSDVESLNPKPFEALIPLSMNKTLSRTSVLLLSEQTVVRVLGVGPGNSCCRLRLK